MLTSENKGVVVQVPIPTPEFLAALYRAITDKVEGYTRLFERYQSLARRRRLYQMLWCFQAAFPGLEVVSPIHAGLERLGQACLEIVMAKEEFVVTEQDREYLRNLVLRLAGAEESSLNALLAFFSDGAPECTLIHEAVEQGLDKLAAVLGRVLDSACPNGVGPRKGRRRDAGRRPFSVGDQVAWDTKNGEVPVTVTLVEGDWVEVCTGRGKGYRVQERSLRRRRGE